MRTIVIGSLGFVVSEIPKIKAPIAGLDPLLDLRIVGSLHERDRT